MKHGSYTERWYGTRNSFVDDWSNEEIEVRWSIAKTLLHVTKIRVTKCCHVVTRWQILFRFRKKGKWNFRKTFEKSH